MVVLIGMLMDAASGAPFGIHMVVFVVVFLGGYSVRHRLFLDSAPTIAAAAFLASMAATILTWFLVAVFLRDYHIYGRFLALAVPRALLTVPFMFPVRAIASWIDRRTLRSAFGYP
jgi:cell shape-determining protein MreD